MGTLRGARAKAEGRERRARSRPLELIVAACLAAVPVLGACRAGASERTDAPSAEFAPALEAAQRALIAGDDEAARRALAVVRARDPRGRDLEIAEELEAVLAGRDLVRGVELSLRVQPAGADGTDTAVELVVAPSAHGGARLDLGAAVLRRDVSRADAAGAQSLQTEMRPTTAAAALVLPADGALVVPLGVFASEAGGGLVLLETFELDLHSGVAALEDGRSVPVGDLRVARAERQRIAAFLPQTPVGPAPLCEFLARAARPDEPPARTTARLMERTVRIPPERRDEALDALAALVPQLPDERVAEAAPALRWLTRERHGLSPAEWREWFQDRGARAGSTTLVLPPSDLPQSGAAPR